MINYRFAHTTVGEESYSSVYDAPRPNRSQTADARLYGWVGSIASVVRAIARWHRFRKTVRELRRLDDRMLRDIGLRRDEITYVAHGLARRGDGWPLFR